MCAGTFRSCFSAVADRSTRTRLVYPYPGYSQRQQYEAGPLVVSAHETPSDLGQTFVLRSLTRGVGRRVPRSGSRARERERHVIAELRPRAMVADNKLKAAIVHWFFREYVVDVMRLLRAVVEKECLVGLGAMLTSRVEMVQTLEPKTRRLRQPMRKVKGV